MLMRTLSRCSMLPETMDKEVLHLHRKHIRTQMHENEKNIRKNGQAMSSRHWIVNWGYYGYCPPGAFLQEPWNTIGTWQIMAADHNMKGRVYFNNRDCKSAHRDWSAIVSRLRQTCVVWESIIARREINRICCFQTHIRVCLGTVFNSDSR